MNKWLVLGMDGNRKWFFWITWQQPLPCPGKCYWLNYHQFSSMVERAGIFWVFPSPHMPKPWAGHTEQPVPCGGQGCHWSSGAWGTAPGSRAAHSIWQDRGNITALLAMSPGYWLQLTKGILVHSNNGPATRKDCAVSPAATVSVVGSPWHSCRVTGVTLQQALQLSNCTNSIRSCSNL